MSRAVALVLLAALSGVLAAPTCYTVSSSPSQYGYAVGPRDCARSDFRPTEIAHADYEDSYNVTGWSLLKVSSNSAFPDEIAAEGAGFIEGFLTADRIYQNAFNTGPATLTPSQVLLDFLGNNTKFMSDMIARAMTLPAGTPDRIYWRHVSLLLKQLDGLSTGYSASDTAKVYPLTPLQIYFISLGGDFEDLPGAPSDAVAWADKTLRAGHCSALLRLLDNNADVYISQETWSSVNSMLRTYKLYDLPFHIDDGLGLVPAVRSSFSSYPGSLFSGDDFYVLSSGLVVQETTIGFFDQKLQRFIQPTTVLEWARNMLANRLATDGASWVEVYSQFNSGTYNNQNMILDYNKFVPGKPLVNGTFTLCEQIPGMIRAHDLSQRLQDNRYFGSYNVAFDPDIRASSGADAMAAQYGDFYNFDLTARAQIFKRDYHKVTDLESMKAMMRYNDFQHDPLSSQLPSCAYVHMTNCTPAYTSEYAIATRCDLNPQDGVYAFGALGFRNHVATDAKISTFSSYDPHGLSATVISGPTYDQQPAFKFSTSPLANTPHLGMPDEFRFPWITVKWD